MSREYTIPIRFGPQGCQANVGDKLCQETQTLEIIKEFNRVYQSKLREISSGACGDNLQLKVSLLQDWIRDLTQQNEMLVKIVEELEKEAADRVSMLEKKLETSSVTSEKAQKEVEQLDFKVKDLERRLSESPKEGDLEALNQKLRLKEEEIDSVKRRSVNAECDVAELRRMLKECEDENRALKDTIFQANRELEKFYEQANSYVQEREEYKRKFAESQAALNKLQDNFETSQSRWQSEALAKQNALDKAKEENLKTRKEIESVRRQSESMSQAQNETIQALQDALREKEKTVKVVPPTESELSWASSVKSTRAEKEREDVMSQKSSRIDETTSTASKSYAAQQTQSTVTGVLETKSREVQYEADEQPTHPSECKAVQEAKKLQAEREEEREIHNQEVSSLKETIETLEKTVEKGASATPTVDMLKTKMEEVECECDAMRRLVNEAKELNKSYQNINTDHLDVRVQELQKNLGEKVREMSEYAELLGETQQKLCWTVCQNNQLKKEITQLLQHIAEYEVNYNVNDERTDYCQKEIELCRGNLSELRNKLLTMKDLLQAKVDQYSQLETEFCVQNNSLCCLKRQIDDNKDKYEKEVCDLRCTIGELQSKLAATEETCKSLNKDYQRTKARANSYTSLEYELEQKFEESLNAANREIATLNDYISKLQDECASIRKELQIKDRLIESAQAQIGRTQAGEASSAEEEVIALKSELEKSLRQYDLLRAKNEALCLQLSEMQQAAKQYSEHNTVSEHHVKKCLCEIHHLRSVRDQLVIQNQGYLKEIQYLRCAYAQLYANFQKISAVLTTFKTKCRCCKPRLGGGENSSFSDIEKSAESSTDRSINSDNTDLSAIQFMAQKSDVTTEELRKSSEFWQNRLADDFLVSKDQ